MHPTSKTESCLTVPLWLHIVLSAALSLIPKGSCATTPHVCATIPHVSRKTRAGNDLPPLFWNKWEFLYSAELELDILAQSWFSQARVLGGRWFTRSYLIGLEKDRGNSTALQERELMSPLWCWRENLYRSWSTAIFVIAVSTHQGSCLLQRRHSRSVVEAVFSLSENSFMVHLFSDVNAGRSQESVLPSTIHALAGHMVKWPPPPRTVDDTWVFPPSAIFHLQLLYWHQKPQESLIKAIKSIMLDC